MDRSEGLTSSANEINLKELLLGEIQVTVPQYQRGYTWKKDKLTSLFNDISAAAEDRDSWHFAGPLITYRNTSQSLGERDELYLIDGQQRITTLTLLLWALTSVYIENGEPNEAKLLAEEVLLLKRHHVPDSDSNSRYIPGRYDRGHLNNVITSVLKKKKFADQLDEQYRYKESPTPADTKSNIPSNYRHALKQARAWWADGGLPRCRSVQRAIIRQITFVQIGVEDPLQGTVIFDRLNSKSTPLTVGDLVKNDIFGRSQLSFSEFESFETETWAPFRRKFNDDKQLSDFFFPYGLLQDSNLKKGEVYAHLRRKWDYMTSQSTTAATEIIDDLSMWADHFLLTTTDSLEGVHPESVTKSFSRLRSLRAPTAVAPFLMTISKLCADKQITPLKANGAIKVLENFLVRRAICGIEPTGLHAVFKRLGNEIDWTKSAGDIKTQMVSRIREHSTVQIPTDEKIRQDILERPMYKASITPWLLLEWDKNAGGDAPNISPTLDHIWPQESKKWSGWSTSEDGSKLHCLPNLALLSKPSNSSALDETWSKKKRDIYMKDSAFKSSRELGEQYEEWTPATFLERAGALADWVNQTWTF